MLKLSKKKKEKKKLFASLRWQPSSMMTDILTPHNNCSNIDTLPCHIHSNFYQIKY